MEAVSVAEESAAGAARDRLKSEGGRTPPGDGRSSPPPNCAICLGACQNKSFTDSCLHQFCFNCLVTWSKIKAECPLCKQTFKSIIHNVRSNHQYEEYLVEQRHTEAEALSVDEPIADFTRRFRYRSTSTTITFPRREGSAIHELLMRTMALPARPDAAGQRRPFRQTVYRHDLWASPLPDITGRFRECTPEFYRENDAQRYRLVPWLTRELGYLLNENHGHIAYVMARILDLLPVCAINSPEFLSAMLPFFGERTEHFLHELHCFASTPFDMLGYDRNVQYGPHPRLAVPERHVISSTDSDGDDSDIVMLSQPHVPAPAPAVAPAAAPTYVVPIETIDHSDSEDSSSEVIMVGYIKPPQDRTPEVVDLLASDSDVLVQENSPPPSTSREPLAPSALVKLTMSRRQRPPDSDTDEDYEPRRLKRPKKRVRSQDSASTTSTRRATPDSSDSSWNPSDGASGVTTSPAARWDDSDAGSHTPPLADLAAYLQETKSKAKERKSNTSKDSRRHNRKVKRKRARSRSPSATANTERRRRKDKKLRKHRSSGARDTAAGGRRCSATAERDRPGTSGLQRDDKRKLRSVVCTLPISSFTGRASRNTRPARPPDAPTGHWIDDILAHIASPRSASTSRERSPHREAAGAQDTAEPNEGMSTRTEGAATRTKTAETPTEAADAPTEAADALTEAADARTEAAAALTNLAIPRTYRWRIVSSTDSEDDLPLNLTVKKSN